MLNEIRNTVRGYMELTKPGIVVWLMITAFCAMVVADRGVPSAVIVVATLLGLGFSAGGAHAVNMWYDRDIDHVMKRTQKRPVVTGRIAPTHALIFGITLAVISFVGLTLVVNWLAAVAALAGFLFYVFVYTIWLKRRSAQNIVIGGAAGAFPPIVGWAGATGHLGLAPGLMFLLIFMWTPPHFWALAVRYRDDYEAANVPMMPVVTSLRRTTLEILVYTVILWALTLLIGSSAHLGWVYAISATVLGALFTFYALRLYRHALVGKANVAEAMRLFHFSITYLSALFILMAVDVLVRNH